MNAIEQLRRDILREYATSISLASEAKYISGAPLRPVVPLDTGSTVFIIGAYPSARFGVMGDERDVPMADNLGPFEPERYYDGERVRVQNSAAELDENYLKPLGVSREKCWVTDLVKVFLFKEGHRRKYAELGAQPPAGYEREAFETLGEKSIPWIERELKLSKPTLVITLGAEVAGIITKTSGQAARNRQLGGDVKRIRIGNVEVDAAHLPHPGIVMREAKDGDATTNPWPALNKIRREPRRVAEDAARVAARRRAFRHGSDVGAATRSGNCPALHHARHDGDPPRARGARHRRLPHRRPLLRYTTTPEPEPADPEHPRAVLRVQPEEAQLVRCIFERYVAGETASAIAASLNRDGVRAPYDRLGYEKRAGAGWATNQV